MIARLGFNRGATLCTSFKNSTNSDVEVRTVIELRTRQLLSPRDAAHRLGLTALRVVQLANEGKIHVIIDSSGKRTFPIEAVETLAKERAAARRKGGSR
jgi:hypothetical protein